MRLIDADALKKQFPENIGVGLWHFTGVWAVIANAPTIEAEPVRHGRWIKRPDERICPFCNDRHSYFGGKEKNYCPNCGAKMDGDSHEG